MALQLSKKNIISLKIKKSPFWGKQFQDLNDAQVPTTEEIRNYQINKIREYENQIFKQKKFNKINSLFQKNNFDINIIKDYENNQDYHLNQIISSIVGNIHTIRGNVYKNKNPKQEYEKASQALIELNQQLLKIKELLNINSPIYEAYLEKLEETLNTLNMQTLDKTGMYAWLKNWTNFQGDIVEQLGTAWLNAKIPQDIKLKTFTTGALTNQSVKHFGSSSKYGKGSLINDLISIDVSNIDLLKNISVDFYINLSVDSDKKEKKEMTLYDFLNYIESYNGDKGQIELSDNAYESLINLSALSVQAKSGFRQKLWNVNNQTSLSISEMLADESNISRKISVYKIFSLLHLLNTQPPLNAWVIDSDKSYDAIFNYGIGSVVNKIMHLNGNTGNQYVLTPDGFTTFSKRMETLLYTQKRIIQLRKSINLNTVLNEKYDIILTGDR